jgi:hypothetical protein
VPAGVKLITRRIKRNDKLKKKDASIKEKDRV